MILMAVKEEGGHGMTFWWLFDIVMSRADHPVFLFFKISQQRRMLRRQWNTAAAYAVGKANTSVSTTSLKRKMSISELLQQPLNFNFLDKKRALFHVNFSSI